jgi:hypothetical protein
MMGVLAMSPRVVAVLAAAIAASLAMPAIADDFDARPGYRIGGDGGRGGGWRGDYGRDDGRDFSNRDFRQVNARRGVYGYAPPRGGYYVPRGAFRRGVGVPLAYGGVYGQPVFVPPPRVRAPRLVYGGGFYGAPLWGAPGWGGYYGGRGWGGPGWGAPGWGGGFYGGPGWGGPGWGGGVAVPIGYHGPRGSFDPCRSSGTGAVIGAIAGGVIGNSVAGYGDGGLGTVIGAGLGAVTGTAIERRSRCGF